MNTSKILINVLVLLLVGVGVWLGYSYFFGGPAEEDTPAITSVRPGETGSVSANQESEFVVLLRRLRNVELDASFLSDMTFNTELRNYTTTLPEKPKGRRNPFATLGTGNIEQASSVPAVGTTTPSGDQAETLSDEEKQQIIDSLGQ